MKAKFMQYFEIFICVSALLIASGCIAEKETASTTHSLQPKTVENRVVEKKSDSYSTLADLTDAFCQDLFQDVGLQKIYLDRSNIKDVSTGDVANFSGYLEQEIDSSCSSKGFTLVYEVDEADYMIGALYRRYGDDLRVFFKYHPQDMSTKKSIDYLVGKRYLPPDSFTNSMKYKARKLAREIAKGQDGKKIYVKPVVEGNNRYVTDFSKAFTARVKNEIVQENKDVIVVDYQATRSIKKTKKTSDLAQSDIAATGADTALSGEYFVEGEIVAIHLTLKSQKDGRIINTAGIDIAKEDISSKLEDSEVKNLAVVADLKEEKMQDKIKLSTTRGSEYPIYQNGEKIIFTMQVSEPLYVYLYNFNPAGELTLLYPFEKNSRQAQLLPGRLYTIPSENDEYDLVVEPPFGKEMLKIFAARSPVPFPQISLLANEQRSRSIGVKRKQEQAKIAGAGRIIHPNDLVDYYRGKGAAMGMEIYEEGFILETRRY